MKTKIFYLAMYILAVLPLMTACESDEPTAIDEPNEQTQLATPVVRAKATNRPLSTNRTSRRNSPLRSSQ